MIDKLKKFYSRNTENKTQLMNIFAFLVLPVICLAVLYIIMVSAFHVK
jgi:hypothetical protein